MATASNPAALAADARRSFLDLIVREVPRVVQAVSNVARDQLAQTTRPDQAMSRRELVHDLNRLGADWQQRLQNGMRDSLTGRTTPKAPQLAGVFDSQPLSLVDDETIELEIVGSRLAQAMMDKASFEFSDLRFRIGSLEHRDEFEERDVFRPQILARQAVDAWCAAGLSLAHWRTAQPILHDEFGTLLQEGYHEANRGLLAHGVGTEVDLRPFLRRTRDAVSARPTGAPKATAFAPTTLQPGAGLGGPAVAGPRFPSPTTGARASVQQGPYQSSNPNLYAPTQVGHLSGGPNGPTRGTDRAAASGAGSSASSGWDAPAPQAQVQDETRLMTRSPGLRASEHAEAVLGRLNRLVSRQVPEFGGSTVVQQAQRASPGLRAAINAAQQALQQRLGGIARAATGTVIATQRAVLGQEPAAAPFPAVGTPELLQELQARKQVLKQAASTPVERATIEIVALMFQSLLTEERIPTSVRVWFARLQMPVLRVAVTEPDFFATTDHPARKLIDRMGSCVMGFESGGTDDLAEPLEVEIKRVVQVVEAYPDTGRRVFQTVLTEFERFLENYFKTTHAAAQKGVSLAQQIEQREALAIQYTIEMRKMLNEVPVHEGVREFLFHVWADVLATTAVQSGQSSEATKRMHRGAADLIWLASAKVSREERFEAIRRLPPLLKLLREGMASANVPAARQDEYIQSLNASLQAAFSARTAAIPTDRLNEVMNQLETLEDLLPDIEHLEIDESMVRDLSDFESSDLEIVSEGGSMPTPAMLAWASNLQVGAWFKLDYRDRIEPVQLAWFGMRKQLCVFVSPQGRGVMFQRHRLASFLQAGLLLPVEEESLTVRATRDAMAKLDADPERLLH